jgi:hypothetical protein
VANADKMRQFIEKLVDSEEVKKEVGEVAHFKLWLKTFQFDSIPLAAIDELV